MPDLHIPRVVGLDLSLTGTGVAVIEGRSIATAVFGATGHNDATLVERHRRLNLLADQIMYQVAPGLTRPDLVVIEGPSYSTVGGHTHDRSGLWWLVVQRLFDLSLPVLEVRPNLRCKYATGKGAAPKNQVVIAVTRRYPEVEFDNDNEADALVLAAMGRRLLAHPVEESMPQTHLESLKTLQLPEMTDAQAG